MDFAPYTEEQVIERLRSLQDRGDPKGRPCERCGNKTKAGKIFGMIICKPCWHRQMHPERAPPTEKPVDKSCGAGENDAKN